MHEKWLLLCLIILLLTSCGQSRNRRTAGNNYSTYPGTDSSIAIEVSPDSVSRSAFEFSDTLTMRMDSTGKIGWVDHTIRMTDLQQQVQDSLMSIYLHTGKLPSRIDIKYLGTVTMGIRGTADDMIRQSQEVVINVVAVKEYGKPYSRLDKQEQDVFRKKYPVLFQKYY